MGEPTIAKILKAFCCYEGLNRSELAKELELTPSTVMALLDGTTDTPAPLTKEKIVKWMFSNGD